MRHLEIAGVLVAPARTRVYGRPAQSKEAERTGAAIGAPWLELRERWHKRGRK